MTCNTSAVAVCCSSASSRSALHAFRCARQLSLTLGKLTLEIGDELLGIG